METESNGQNNKNDENNNNGKEEEEEPAGLCFVFFCCVVTDDKLIIIPFGSVAKKQTKALTTKCSPPVTAKANGRKRGKEEVEDNDGKKIHESRTSKC